MKTHGSPAEKAILLPSSAVAMRCIEFFTTQVPTLVKGKDLRIVSFYPCLSLRIGTRSTSKENIAPFVSAVIFPRIHSKVAKTFWQHSGEGVSSRRADFCRKAYDDGLLSANNQVEECMKATSDNPTTLCKGPRRYQKRNPSRSTRAESQSRENALPRVQGDINLEEKEHVQFVEERFGRNLDMSLAANAKVAIRRRIAGALTADVDLDEALELTEETLLTRRVQDFSEHDVYLYPTGMSSIFNTHRILMECRGELKSVCFGYVKFLTLR